MQLDMYIASRGIKDDRTKVMALLQHIGKDTLGKIVDWKSPSNPLDDSFADLIKLLDSKFSQGENLFALRVQLFNESQQPDQSIQQYFAHMTQLIGKCKFTSKEENGVLAILRGLASNELRQFLMLPTNDISTIDKLQTLAMSYEQSCVASKDMIKGKHQANIPMQFHKVEPTNRCTRCGKSHSPSNCPAFGKKCAFCKKMGHFKIMCKAFKRSKQNQLEEEDDGSASGNEMKNIFSLLTIVSEEYDPPIMLTAKVNGKLIKFQHDSGAVVTVVNKALWQELGNPKLHPHTKPLRSYSGVIKVLGKCQVDVEMENKKKKLWLTVVEKGDSLFGRNWMKNFEININPYYFGKCAQVKNEDRTEKLAKLLKEYEDIFEKSVGKCKIVAKLKLKENAKPKFLKARKLPYALREKVEEQLQKLVDQGVLKQVQHSNWATPIVPVRKSNGDIRICGDYRSTINPQLDVNQYPLPRIDDMLHELNGGASYSKLDLYSAYHQIPLDEESKELTTISTHKGLFQYQYLPFGPSSAVAIFQETMEKCFHAIPGFVNYLDDMTVTAKSDDEHLERLKTVFERCRKDGFRLNLEKCAFLEDKIEFLGHEIDAHGVRPLKNKVQGFVNMPDPTNVKQLESFLGLANYYGKFIKNFSTIAAPLNEMKKKGVKWQWNENHKVAVEQIKKALLESKLLTHYDPEKALFLAADASEYGIGAVIYHKDTDGTERVIANASRKLTPSERNYAQIEKEALAIIFGVEKFNQYLLGRRFTLFTDHQPLLRIFGPRSVTNQVAIKRLTRWSLILMQYDYVIEYKSTSDFSNADGLSRLPDPTAESEIPKADDDETIEKLLKVQEVKDQSSPLNLDILACETQKDKDLEQVFKWTKNGWPDKVEERFKKWQQLQDNLSLGPGYLKYREKPIVPGALRIHILKQLHEVHIGRDRMLMLARDNFWYPGMSNDIRKLAQSCEICNGHHKGQKERLHPWEKPDKFWDRIHIDFAQFKNQQWLVVIDAYSNWLEVEKCAKIDTTTTIKKLQGLFARHGLVKQIVSDGGPAFRSEQFKKFCESRAIIHTKSPPYHPQSNGAAERAVRTFKEWTEKHIAAGHGLDEAVANTLLLHRSTRETPTKESPAEKAFGRKLRTRLTIHACSVEQISGDFEPGDKVWVRCYNEGMRWRPGWIKRRNGAATYLVECENQIIFRHRDQLRKASEICINLPNHSLYTENDFYNSFDHSSPVQRTSSSDYITSSPSSSDSEKRDPTYKPPKNYKVTSTSTRKSARLQEKNKMSVDKELSLGEISSEEESSRPPKKLKSMVVVVQPDPKRVQLKEASNRTIEKDKNVKEVKQELKSVAAEIRQQTYKTEDSLKEYRQLLLSGQPIPKQFIEKLTSEFNKLLSGATVVNDITKDLKETEGEAFAARENRRKLRVKYNVPREH
uniref:Reverse transcriptase n=1 Tax=Panagrolaimus sp. PS1159 TaxID=55785 RepID=A0AC35ES89_9BILA